MIEFEKKVILTKREYDFFVYRNRKMADSVIQINHYFDTDDFEWDRRGITCRIREKQGQYWATIKAHRSSVGECSIETVRPAENERDDRLFVTMGVKPQGCLITRRTPLLRCEGLTTVLDENSYLGCIDYELEIEYDSSLEARAKMVLHSMADDLALHHLIDSSAAFYTRANAGGSKSERFFSRKKLQQQFGGGFQ